MADCNHTKYRARFGGISFIPLDATSTHGRDGIVHKFVDNDTPAGDDTGRAVATYSITGQHDPDYGESWLDHADLMAKEAEKRGPISVTHPAIGTDVLVFCHNLTITYGGFESIDGAGKGVVIYQFTLSEWGRLEYPQIGDIAQLFIDSGYNDINASTRGLITRVLTDGFSLRDGALTSLVTLPNRSYNYVKTTIGQFRDLLQTNFQDAMEWNKDTAETYQLLQNAGTDTERAADIFVQAVDDIFVFSGQPDEVLQSILDSMPKITPGASIFAESEYIIAMLYQQSLAIPATLRLASIWADRGFASRSEYREKLAYISGILSGYIDFARANCLSQHADAVDMGLFLVRKEFAGAAAALPASDIVDLGESLPSLVASYRIYGTPENRGDVECMARGKSAFFTPQNVPFKKL